MSWHSDCTATATPEDEPPLIAFKGKSAAIVSASPGGYGGARSLAHLRPLLENIHVHVIGGQVTIPKAHEAFTESGRLVDGAQMAAVEQLAGRLVEGLRGKEG